MSNTRSSVKTHLSVRKGSTSGLGLALLFAAAPLLLAELPSPVRLVTGDDYAPFSDQNLPDGGLATHLVVYLFEQMDLPVRVDVTGWAEGYQAAHSGEFAGTFPYIQSTERQADFLYSDPMFSVSSFAYVDQSSSVRASSPEDLAGLTLCLPEGFAHGPALEGLVQSGAIKRVTPTDMPSCFAMLQTGEADFVKINRYVARELLRNAGVPHSAIRALPFSVETLSMHFIAPRSQAGSQVLIDQINHELVRMHQNGEFTPFIDDYLSIIYPRQDPSKEAP